MKSVELLTLLAANRELIQQNNRQAETELQLLNRQYASGCDQEYLLSLELNNSMAEFYFHSAYQKAIDNSQRTIRDYNDADSSFIAWHLWLIGHCYASMGNDDAAFQYLHRALEAVWLLTELQPVLKHEIYHSLAMNNHLGKGSVDVTLLYLKQALKAIEDTTHEIRKANCLMGVGNVYLENHVPDKALTNYLAAAVIYEAKFSRQNMSACYSNTGLCYLNLENLDQAEKYLLMALELQLSASSPEHLSNTYHNLSLLYKEKKHWAKAQDCLNKSKQIVLATGNKPALEASEQLQVEINSLDMATYLYN